MHALQALMFSLKTNLYKIKFSENHISHRIEKKN